MPPALISHGMEPVAYLDEYKEWLLDMQLKGNNKSSCSSELVGVWLCFAQLLGDEDKSERHLHEFLQQHPLAVYSYATNVRSEVWLDKKFRIDLVVWSTGVQTEVLLIELEHHRHQMFTKSGQPRAEVTHAKQQVEDWLRYLREHPNHELSKELNGRCPKGQVVIGRSRNCSDDDLARLAHLNERSEVQVITYDQLLDRFGDFILEQLDDEPA